MCEVAYKIVLSLLVIILGWVALLGKLWAAIILTIVGVILLFLALLERGTCYVKAEKSAPVQVIEMPDKMEYKAGPGVGVAKKPAKRAVKKRARRKK